MATKQFGTRLRELRKQAGFNQRELADKAGINFTYLSKIESGAMPPPSEKVIVRIAEALNADKDELMTLAGRIPPDIVQILKNREALQFLRSKRMQKKVNASSKRRGAIPMKFNSLARVAIAITLVASIGASLWFASPPLRLRAFNVAAPVANSPISGNTTYLLGEKVTIPAGIKFDPNEFKDFQSVSLNVSGPESFSKSLPFVPGSYNYTDVPGSLDVTVSWGSGVGPYGYGYPDRYGYGYSTGSGNISYSIKWTPPYALTSPPTPPPPALPGADPHFDISMNSTDSTLTGADVSYPNGLAYDSTNQTLYILVPAYYDISGMGSGPLRDIIIKTDRNGNYNSFIPAPGDSWNTEAITFLGNTLYGAYTDWSTYPPKGIIKKYVSDNWTSIAGLSNLNAIGGLDSDGTSLFIAYRDQLTIDKRDPTTGAQIQSFDLSGAWGGGGIGGMGGMGPPIWGFDALAYDGTNLYAAQGETVIQVAPSTGAKTNEWHTSLWNIRGLTFVTEAFSGTFKILYIATTAGQVRRASLPGAGAVTVENTPIGSYSTQFKVIADSTTYPDSSSFTLTKLSTAPTVTISAPSQGFAYGAGAETIIVSGSINDPSITTVTVGIALPEVTAFQDNTENATQTNANWQHNATTGSMMWGPPYSTADLWHRSTVKSGDTKQGAGAVGAAWRYANPVSGNYETPGFANAGVLQTRNTVSIGDDNKLIFWTWYDGELDFWPDRKLVEVSTDGSNWQPVAWLAQFWPPFKPPDVTQAQFDSLTPVPPRVWTKVEVSLASYADDDIYLRFRFDTMDDFGNNFEGWYIDDVSISGAGFQGVDTTVDANLQFSTTFTLAEGSNVISATAKRTNYEPELTGTASVTGSLDTIAPVINLNPVTTPTNQQYQIISGTVTEANFDRLNLYKGGVLKYSTTVLGTGNTFSQSILLDEGTNSIMVKVTDKVGLSANVTATIKLDTVGPAFEDVFTSRYDVAYKTGELSARPGDDFFIALKVTDTASDVASVKLVIPNESDPANWANAIGKNEIPEAVIDSWGISTATKAAMNYVIPMQLPAFVPAGDYSWTVKAWDTAGNSSNITVQTRVVTTLEAFNIYLMPNWNLVSTPVIPTSSNITTIMASANASGLFERVWYYDSSNTSDPWKLYEPGAPSDLTTFETGRGYWIKMKPLTSANTTAGIDNFTEAGRVSGPMAAGLPNTPAPVKLTITGQVLEPGATVPPTYSVVAGWNLVGLHSELSRPVSTALQSVTVPQQKWGSLLQYLNYINFPIHMGEDSRPEIDLGRFDRLISTDTMQPGRGFWLYMVEAGTIVP